MEQNTYQLNDVLAVLRRRKLQFLITLAGLLVIALVITFALPSIYRSTATILIEEEDIPSDLIRSTISSYADQQIQVISARVMTTDNLLRLINELNLYRDKEGVLSSAELVEMVREDATMEMVSANVVDPRNGRPTQATIAFTLSYDHESPDLAQRVASKLVTLYMSANIEERTTAATSTTSFFRSEAQKLNAEINELEQQLSDFKSQNDGALPSQYAANVQGVTRTENELLETERKLRALDERRIYLSSEISMLDPQTPVRGSSGSPILEPADRLRSSRAEYSTLLSLYGEQHPDVMRLKRQVEALEEQLGISASAVDLDAQIATTNASLAAARERYTEDHPEVARLERQLSGLQEERASAVAGGGFVTPAASVTSSVTVRAAPDADAADVGRLYRGKTAALVDDSAEWYQVRLDDGQTGYVSKSWTTLANAPAQAVLPPSNPAFIALQAQLQAAEAEARSLIAKREILAGRLQASREALSLGPEVERVYSSLTRDIDSLRDKYRQLKAQEREAALAAEVEKERKGERFSLIEPPIAPTTPHWPNRLALLFLGLVLSLAGAIGVVAVAESLDDAVRGTDSITSLVGAAPLAVIPFISTEEVTAHVSPRKLMIIAGSTVAAVTLLLLAVHFLYEPLDVLWFRVMRNLGV